MCAANRRRFSCKTCGRTFARLVKFEEHEGRPDAHAFPCKQCGFGFHSYWTLYDHLKTHGGDAGNTSKVSASTRAISVFRRSCSIMIIVCIC